MSPNVYWPCRTNWGIFLLAHTGFGNFYWPGAIGSPLASSPGKLFLVETPHGCHICILTHSLSRVPLERTVCSAMLLENKRKVQKINEGEFMYVLSWAAQEEYLLGCTFNQSNTWLSKSAWQQASVECSIKGQLWPESQLWSTADH